MTKKTIILALVTIFVAFSSGSGLAGGKNHGKRWGGFRPRPHGCDITVTCPDSIQDALDSASPGDTICVEGPGICIEDLVVEQADLELVCKDDATIKGVQLGGNFPEAFPNINILANGVSIHGCTIESPDSQPGMYASGIVLTGKNIEIYNNAFLVGTGDISQAIQTWKDDNAPEGLRDISGLKIYNNTFKNLDDVDIGLYEGIFINSQSDEPKRKIEITGNVFSGHLIRAIATERSKTHIRRNTMTADKSAGDFAGFPRGIELRAGEKHIVNQNQIDPEGEFKTGIVIAPAVIDSIIITK